MSAKTMHGPIIFLISIIALSVCSLEVEGEPAEEQINLFFREFPAAAKQIERLYSRIRAEGELIKQNASKHSSEAHRFQFTFASDHGFKKAELVQMGGEEKDRVEETVYCLAKKTSFILKRSSANHVYQYDTLGNDFEESEMVFNNYVGKYLAAPYAVNGFPLTTIMKLDGFEVLTAEKRTESGRSFLHVSCQYGQAPKTELDIVFDLDAAWVIRRSEWRPRGSAGNALITEITYDDHNTHDSIPFPRLVELNEPPNRLSRCVFFHYARQSTPRNEFTLSHYGLAALDMPVSETPAFRISPAVVCLILGVLGLCVTVAIRRLAAR